MVKRGLKPAAMSVLLAVWSGGLLAATAPMPFQAVDATGAVVGDVVRLNFDLSSIQVGTEVAGRLVFMTLEPDRITHGAQPRVYFRRAGCRGLAFMSTSNRGSFDPRVAIAGRRATLYFAAYQDAPQPALVRSVLNGGVCEPFELRLKLVRAHRVVNLMTVFRPPFRVVRAQPPSDRN